MTSQQNSSSIQSDSPKTENVIEVENDNNETQIDIGNDDSGKSNRERILTPQEISKTFRIMAYRKSERQVRGRYRRKSYTRLFWFVMFMIIFLSLAGAGISGLLKNVFNSWISWPEFVVLLVALAMMMYIYYKITEVVRWCFYWLVLATIILLILNGGLLLSENENFLSTPSVRIVIIVFAVIEGLTVFIWVLVRYIYPYIVKEIEWLDTIWWWRIKQMNKVHVHEGGAIGCFQYVAWDSYSLYFKRGIVTYTGEVNANGRPHGRGEWIDDLFDGECLRGIWEDGVPIGPFQSRSSGTGDAFHAVRVALVKNSRTPWNESRLFPRPHQSGLDVAVASVECSVSGKYLKNLPQSTLLFPPKPRDSMDEESKNSTIKDHLKRLITFTSVTESYFGVNSMAQSVIIIKAEDDGLAIAGMNTVMSRDEVVVRRVPKRKDDDHSKIEYVLEIDGWGPSGMISTTSPNDLNSSEYIRSSMECIVFIHGFNCTSKYAMETFGQFLALGDFPSYIKPFVFSPPGTNSLWYFGVKEQASLEQAVNDFRIFLQDLRDTGFRAVHILCHSMGCMLILQYIKTFEGIFTINSLEENTNQYLGNEERSGTLMRLSTVTLLNPDVSLTRFTQDYARLKRYCDHITIYSNARDFPLKIGEILERDRSLGRLTSDLYHEGKLMDVDLIDTTQLDVNIHKVRHNFFNLNRLLVDDLFDIIVVGRRARGRTSRLNRRIRGVGQEGITYTFLVAPSYVVNK